MSLSDKQVVISDNTSKHLFPKLNLYYKESDVKEFIKRLKEELKKNCLVYPQVIKKLAGDTLI